MQWKSQVLVLCEVELVIKFDNYGVSDMISKDYVITADGTTSICLFAAMNRYAFNVSNNIIKGGQAIILLWQNENVMDGREVWISIKDFYEKKSNHAVVNSQCHY